MPDCEKTNPYTNYQITIQGNLGTEWTNWFNWLELSYKEDLGITILRGPIADQAELRGIMNKLWDLNQAIIAVSQLQDRI
jgi:hypothetical protein